MSRLDDHRPRRTFASVAGLLLALTGPAAIAADTVPTAEQVRFFESKVRPILVDQCVKCHGPEKQKSHLRLDSRAAAITGGEQGAAVVPGKPDESLLITAVRHEDDALKMPPSKKLSAEVVADLTRWVSMGAPWPGSADDEAKAGASATPGIRRGPMVVTEKDRAHWAFRPIRRPKVPGVAGLVRNPIDAFVLEGLKERGLKANPEADRRTLIRRVTYDLTGLPPTPAEIDAFLNDPAADAYDKVVDRLLDSPHYGEAWGRHWLDLVRFAETNSYERDNPKPNAWRFRDYVIRSFNNDKPYNRFVREQLAGDEMKDGGPDGLVATGFYRLGIWDDEPTDRDQARYDGLDDIVATTAQVFLGLTVDCARCHDHKIDPIPQADYYRMVSFFQNVNHFRNGGPTDEAPLFESDAARLEGKRRLADLQRRRDVARVAIESIESEFLAKSNSGGTAEHVRADIEGLTYRFYRDTWQELPDFDSLKPEQTGELSAGQFDLAPRSRDDAFGFVYEGTLVVPADGNYTFHLDSDDGSRLTVDGHKVAEYDGIHGLGMGKSVVMKLAKGGVPVRLDYFQNNGGLGLNVAWSGPGFVRRPLSAKHRSVGEVVAANASKSTPIDVVVSMRARGRALLGDSRFDEWVALRRKARELAAETPEVPFALCVTETGKTAADTFILLRGNPHVPGTKVEPGFLSVLGATGPEPATSTPTEKTTGRRSALADWITSPTNPLPARVMANRVWQFHFGRGIVRSPNNFGTQGDKPTHPELLDWLASELVDGGWRLKPLHRKIVTSGAYRASSKSNAETLAKDPVNDGHWRFDPRRLTAEEVRDSVLAVSGDLNPGMFGPGVYPEIPADVMAGQSVPGKGWGKSSPADQARRSIYVHVKRSLVTPILESFDLAETDRSTPVRFSTTQPTQALAMINGKFLNDQARVFAARLKREAGDETPARVTLALRLATGREPAEAEVRRGVELVGRLTADDALGADDALKAFALVVLNLNEFVYLD